MPPPDTATLATDPLTAEAVAAAAIESHHATKRRHALTFGAGLSVLGLALVVGAAWIVTSPSGTWRGAVALVGGILLWMGLQRLGELRWGPRFELGVWVSLAWVALVVLMALFADLLPIKGVDEQIIANSSRRPGLELDEPLGYDLLGRSMLSRCIHGARVSLAIGVLAVALGMAIGGVLGLIAGYFRGILDGVISVLSNATLAFPPLILLISLVSVRGASITILVIGLGIITAPTFVRLTRAQTLVVAQREYVLAARSIGAKGSRILRRDIVPNVITPVAAYAFLVVALLIVAEGSLSFIGLGVPPPRPSWGGMIADHQDRFRGSPHLVFVPATWMFLTVLSLNRLGEWARARASGREAKL